MSWLRSLRAPSLLLRLGTVLLTGVVCVNHVVADPQSKSYSHWQIMDNSVSATFTIGVLELTRLPQREPPRSAAVQMRRHLMAEVSVTSGSACERREINDQPAAAGFNRVQILWQCPPGSAEADVQIGLLFDHAPSHIHFARFDYPDRPGSELLYTRRQRSHHLPLGPAPEAPPPPGLGDTLATYIQFGFEHILIGIDHIAFLLTLMLLAARLRDIIFIVTGFTLGHSTTLSLAVLGIVSPNAAMVEAMIGFTIALVAAENIAVRDGGSTAIAWSAAAALAALAMVTALSGLGPPSLSLVGLALFTLCYLRLSDSEDRARQMRPGVTTLFGLIHGFGFAGVLMEVGLPQQAVVPALLGFNVGVELGQIAIVAVLCGLGMFIRRLVGKATENLRVRVEDTGSALLCGLGVFWFVQRGFF